MTFSETFDALVEAGADFDIMSDGTELARVKHDRTEELWTIEVRSGPARVRATTACIDSVRTTGDGEGHVIVGWDLDIDARPPTEDAPVAVHLPGEPTVLVLRPGDLPVCDADIETLVDAYRAYNEARSLELKAFGRWREQVVALRRLVGLEDGGAEKDVKEDEEETL